MTLIFNHPYRYTAERVIRSFTSDAEYVLSEVCGDDYTVDVKLGGDTVKQCKRVTDGDKEQVICSMLYDALSRLTGTQPAWGIFTGVRPIKYIRENRQRALEMKIRGDKLALADEIIGVQDKIISRIPPDRFQLYVGIPFCPSRCRYCSFVSEAAGKNPGLIPKYVGLLTEELRLLGDNARKAGLKPDTVYIGGGTPTVLPLDLQIRVYGAISDNFDLSDVREYTVEAGRPETLDGGVLSAIKKAGATRISINPQSMNPTALETIGRGHTARDVIKAYELARGYGFSSINMDLISGLPGESMGDFADSLRRVIELNPDNITVHSFAFKRGSDISAADRSCVLEKFGDGDFTAAAYGELKAAGYSPYYLYRLRESRGDNIGYCRGEEHIGLYNVYIMDGKVNVLAAGCGGASRVSGDGGIVRHYNFKYPYEYVSRFGEIVKKGAVLFAEGL